MFFQVRSALLLQKVLRSLPDSPRESVLIGRSNLDDIIEHDGAAAACDQSLAIRRIAFD